MTVNHKKFMDIQRLKADYALCCNKGDIIQITEKIDGANSAIRYDSETDSIVAQSRKNILDTSNNLRGFYEWSQTLDKELVKSVLGDNLILFGEWLCSHTVKYPDDKYNNLYSYDVYDTEKEQYLPQSEVKEIVSKLGLIYVPVFYEGEFISWEHCMSFVGQTKMGGDTGEGVVIKNQTRLNDSNRRLPFYIKIVSDKFQEVKKVKKKKPNPQDLEVISQNLELAKTIITRARVEKMLNKFVDECILPENWGATEMPIIAKNITKAIYEDCIKEESDIVAKIENFGKVANKICMQIAKEIMTERENVIFS